MKKEIEILTCDICVCCGNPVPEGVMVCNICKENIATYNNPKSLKKHLHKKCHRG